MRGYRLDSLRSKRTTSQAATGTIGSGANGVVTVTVASAGGLGNQYSIRAVLAGAPDTALSAALSAFVLTVTLGTDGGGLADATKNTATLVAAEIDALAEFTAAASGTGATAVPVTAARSFSGGHDALTLNDLAKQANVSVPFLVSLERGGNCEVHEAERIAAALGIAVSALGVGV